jgi:hypothetical protein
MGRKQREKDEEHRKKQRTFTVKTSDGILKYIIDWEAYEAETKWLREKEQEALARGFGKPF